MVFEIRRCRACHRTTLRRRARCRTADKYGCSRNPRCRANRQGKATVRIAADKARHDNFAMHKFYRRRDRPYLSSQELPPASVPNRDVISQLHLKKIGKQRCRRRHRLTRGFDQNKLRIKWLSSSGITSNRPSLIRDHHYERKDGDPIACCDKLQRAHHGIQFEPLRNGHAVDAEVSDVASARTLLSR